MAAAYVGRKMRMDFTKHCLANFDSGLGLKIVQIVQSERHSRQGGRDRGLAGIGVMQFPIHQIVMHLSTEGRFHLRDCAFEEDLVAAVGHPSHSQSLGLQPGSDLGDGSGGREVRRQTERALQQRSGRRGTIRATVAHDQPADGADPPGKANAQCGRPQRIPDVRNFPQ